MFSVNLFKGALCGVIFSTLGTTINAQVFIKETATGNGSGTSWDNAYGGNQLTNVLNTTGDVKVYLASGNYTISAMIDVAGKNFYVKGGFPANATGTDTSAFSLADNPTVITEASPATGLNRRFQIRGGGPTRPTNFRIEGLTLTGFDNPDGGGVFNMIAGAGAGSVNVSVIRCIMHNNKSPNGGVFYSSTFTGQDKSLLVDGCVIANNRSTTGYGGSFYFTTMYGTAPSTNIGTMGGDDHLFRIQNSSLRNNISNRWGGSFFLTTVADMHIQNITLCSDPLIINPGGEIIANDNMSQYGGLAALTTTNRISLVNSTFAGGRTKGGNGTRSGTAIFTETIYEPGNIISGNRFIDNKGFTPSVPNHDIDLRGNVKLSISNNEFDKVSQSLWLSDNTIGSSILNITGNIHGSTNINYDCDEEPTPLGVSLIDFKGSKYDIGAILSWTTLKETNNQGFEIQRSYDGVNFQTIGNINSHSDNGNSNVRIHYEYIDAEKLVGKVYYRLVQIDIDKTQTFSKIVTLYYNLNNTITVFPNPAKDVVNLSDLSGTGTEVIYLSDATGRLVDIFFTEVQKTSLEISTNKLQEGSYILTIQRQNGSNENHKLVILK